MEWDRDNYDHYEMGDYADPLSEWNAGEQPTGWGSPTPLQHKSYSPSRPTGDANPLTLA
jgi:hypothetical protein